MTAKILALIGADDPIIPPAQRDAFVAEMTAAKVDWQLVLYGGVQHSFTNPAAQHVNMPGIVYDAPTERRSWQAMRDLFDEVFAGPAETSARQNQPAPIYVPHSDRSTTTLSRRSASQAVEHGLDLGHQRGRVDQPADVVRWVAIMSSAVRLLRRVRSTAAADAARTRVRA